MKAYFKSALLLRTAKYQRKCSAQNVAEHSWGRILWKHIFERVHREGISEFICHPCQKSFSNSSNLQRFLISTLHSGVDKWQKAKRQILSTSSSTSANVRWVFWG